MPHEAPLTTTIVDAVTAPTPVLISICEITDILTAMRIPELAQRIHDEIVPWVMGVNAKNLSEELSDLVNSRSGWTELFCLISDAANALNYCHTHPAVDGVPWFLTEDDKVRFDEIEQKRAEMRGRVA